MADFEGPSLPPIPSPERPTQAMGDKVCFAKVSHSSTFGSHVFGTQKQFARLHLST